MWRVSSYSDDIWSIREKKKKKKVNHDFDLELDLYMTLKVPPIN